MKLDEKGTCRKVDTNTYISGYKLAQVGVPQVIDVWPLKQCYPALVCLARQKTRLYIVTQAEKKSIDIPLLFKPHSAST